MKKVTHPPAGLLATLENALERVAVVVAELEAGETETAHAVASDLELDLEAAVRRASPAELRQAA